jgi:O-antigen/teichoic acid export membrane protein
VSALDSPPVSSPRPLTGGAVMAGASRVTIALTGAVTTIAIARLLGPDGSGAYFVAQSVMLVLTVAATFGVEHGIAYYVSAGAWAPRPACRAALRMALGAGVAGAALGLAARLLWPSAFAGLPVWATAVVVAGLPFALTWFYVSFVALAVDRYEAYVVPPAAQSALVLVLAVPGAIAFDVEGAVVALTAASAIVGVAAAEWARRRLPRAGADRAAAADAGGMLRRAVAFGIKGYAANALQLVNYRLDVFVLSAVASAAVVGRYAVAVAVTSVLWLLPQALSEVLFPRVAHLSARDEEAHREMVEVKSLRHVTLAVVVTTLLLAGALLVLVVPIYGEDFRDAIELGLILLPGTALLGIGGVMSATIVGRGRPMYSLYITLVVTPLTIGLYALLIPELEATGAALASSLSYAGNFALTCVFYRRVTGRPVARSLVPGRSELADLRRLPGAVREWARRS